MGNQPTNGPYHWGNGPKPRKQSKSSGGASNSAMAIAIGIFGGAGTVIAGVIAYLAHGYGAF